MLNLIIIKSKLFLLFLILSALIFFPECGKKYESMNDQEHATELRTVKDMLGNSIKIPKTVTRAALFGGPTGQIAYLLGAQNQLCAVSAPMRNSTLINEMDPNIQNIPAPRTTNGVINIEELILSNPEIVIAGDTDGHIVERKTSFTVAYLQSNMNVDFKGIIEEVKFFAKIFNAEERADAYETYLYNTLKMIETRVKNIPNDKRKIVYNGYGKNHLVTIGGDAFLDKFIKAAGCRNAALEVSTLGKRDGLHTGLRQVSMELVLDWNPDIIIINTNDSVDMYNDSRWKTVKAVRNKQVYKQPAGIFVLDRPTAESAYLYTLWLAVNAYPDKFKDFDLNSEVKKFYKEIFNFSLSKKQVKNILNGTYNRSMMKGIKF